MFACNVRRQEHSQQLPQDIHLSNLSGFKQCSMRKVPWATISASRIRRHRHIGKLPLEARLNNFVRPAIPRCTTPQCVSTTQFCFQDRPPRTQGEVATGSSSEQLGGAQQCTTQSSVSTNEFCYPNRPPRTQHTLPRDKQRMSFKWTCPGFPFRAKQMRV